MLGVRHASPPSDEGRGPGRPDGAPVGAMLTAMAMEPSPGPMPAAQAERWRAAWRRAGASRIDMAGAHALWHAWGEPARHYHTRQHLLECLSLYDVVRDEETHAGEVELGLWFHDAVYAIGAHDNEARSADWLARTARDAGLGEAAVARLHALVMATCHDAPPATADARLLVDVDLAILGAPPARFDEYERQVRREYAQVDETTFRARRAALLETFLARASIYATPWFVAHREAQARTNLARSIAALRHESSP